MDNSSRWIVINMWQQLDLTQLQWTQVLRRELPSTCSVFWIVRSSRLNVATMSRYRNFIITVKKIIIINSIQELPVKAAMHCAVCRWYQGEQAQDLKMCCLSSGRRTGTWSNNKLLKRAPWTLMTGKQVGQLSKLWPQVSISGPSPCQMPDSQTLYCKFNASLN